MTTTDNILPYDFDLHYDIKTKDQLETEILRLKTEFEGLVHLCSLHNVEIPKTLIEFKT